jgi:phosphoethanolamine N-methyltransferase
MTREFLDNNQYTELSILRYEAIYGHNYISPGGENTTDQFIDTLKLLQGMRVLDIGCGLGGPAYRLASKYGVHVHGIDLSSNMIRIAKTRLKEEGLQHLVTLEQGNCLEIQTETTFNVVYSRDVFLHIKDKARLFEVIAKTLVPSGRLCFSDYCLGQTKSSPDFQTYMRERNYSLQTVEEYTKLLEDAGFKNVCGEDRTDIFIQTLKHELKNLKKSSLLKQEKKILYKIWQDKIKRAERGEQGWGWFSGEKSQ